MVAAPSAADSAAARGCVVAASATGAAEKSAIEATAAAGSLLSAWDPPEADPLELQGWQALGADSDEGDDELETEDSGVLSLEAKREVEVSARQEAAASDAAFEQSMIEMTDRRTMELLKSREKDLSKLEASMGSIVFAAKLKTGWKAGQRKETLRTREALARAQQASPAPPGLPPCGHPGSRSAPCARFGAWPRVTL